MKRSLSFALIWTFLLPVSLLISGGSMIALAAPLQGGQTLRGTVVDTTGGAIAGAAITLKTPVGDRETVSDFTGSFVFEDVPAGPGTLTVTFQRFSPTTIDLPGGGREVRIVLNPETVTESVTVRAPAVTAITTATAMRTPTPLRDVPQSVSVITRDLIADQTMRSLADVVRYVPGLGMAQGEGHRDAAIFRGNTSTADFLVDGVRDDTQYLRDLYNVDRVEVLKGPNGMIFGRGGAGGVINRVTRQADWMPSREVSLQGGSWGYRRLTTDLGDAITRAAAVRVTGLYENSGTYRTGADIERYGFNPSAAFALGSSTTLRTAYESFHDHRTVDRGVPSLDGRPLDIDPSTFFGSADLNVSRITVNAFSSSVDHKASDRFAVRNRFTYADYDKFYENLVPGAVDAARATVALTGYNSATQRNNLFNQTDVIVSHRTGRVGHSLVAGVELGRQVTDNRRLTAFFSSLSPATTSIHVPLTNPTTTLPVEFRAAGTDADNHGVATAAAFYAQDQVELSQHVHAVVGIRYDRFKVTLLDHRSGTEFAGNDGLLSPRLALVYKPIAPLSLYASYARSNLPRAGEQLSSLSLSNQALDPETFRNYEVGAKWEITPALAFTTAVYRAQHGNVVVRDSVDPTVSHLVDGERTTGLELETAGALSDHWTVHGGYAYQHGEITRSLSSAVVAGARLAQVPRHSFSLWNKYHVSRLWSVGLGIISRADSFVATDNTVVLPGFTRLDGAAFFNISQQVRLHVNVENVLDETYYWAAHGNNNIAPGSPRAVRVALTTRF